jgi:putative ABC transport system permease protein
MTLVGFVQKSTFRNRRRCTLMVLSMSFSFLLLCILMSAWRSYYIDPGSVESAKRLVVIHKVSLANPLPAYYREQIRRVSGVTYVVPMSWFGGIYRDSKPENFFARFGTDPEEFFNTYRELSIPVDQQESWIKDRAGAVADIELAKKYGWKIGDRIVIKGDIYPMTLELTLRGLFTSPVPNRTMYFNWKYAEEATTFAKGKVGTIELLVHSPEDANRVAMAIDGMFSNAPEPTKTQTQRAYQLSFITMLGNVKTFILSISLAVVFTTLLVSGNTMSMSLRERTREVAVLRTLGFPRQTIVSMMIGETATMSLLGGIGGSFAALGLMVVMVHSPQQAFFIGMQRQWIHVAFPTCLLAVCLGSLSSFLPAYNASRIGIVEGLRQIG